MRFFIFILSFLFINDAIAQYGTGIASFYNDSVTVRQFGVSTDISINSNSINNKLVFSYLDGNPDMMARQSSSDRMQSFNKLGFDANSSVFYSFKKDSLLKRGYFPITLFVRFADRRHLDARFSKDAFNLLAFGNKQFAGQSADLSNIGLNYLKYQQIQAGFLSDIDGNNRIGVGISFLKGQDFQYLQIPEAKLFTDSLGEYIDITARLSVGQSDTAKKGWQTFNGLGVSGDFMYEFRYDILKNNDNVRGKIRIEFKDFGFIKWNKQSIIQALDTSKHYEGIVINDFTQLNDSSLQNQIDSILPEFNIANEKRSIIVFLPAYLSFSLIQNVGKHHFFATAMIRSNANFDPFLLIRYRYEINKKLEGGISFNAGGYGRKGIGVDATYRIKNFHITLGTHNLNGVILPKQSRGLTAYLNLRKTF